MTMDEPRTAEKWDVEQFPAQGWKRAFAQRDNEHSYMAHRIRVHAYKNER